MKFFLAYSSLSTSLLLFASNASALFISWQSPANNISGSIDGVAFTNSSWLLEYEIDQSNYLPSTGSVHHKGQWVSSNGARPFVSGRIQIDGVDYNFTDQEMNNAYLALGTASRTSAIVDPAEYYDLFDINFGYGSSLHYKSDYQDIFPALGDEADFTTWQPGVVNEGGKFLRFSNTDFLTDLGTVTINQVRTSDTGDYYGSCCTIRDMDEGIVFRSTATSYVPVPAAAWLFGSALVGLGILRRR